jgi:hypothetical protein
MFRDTISAFLIQHAFLKTIKQFRRDNDLASGWNYIKFQDNWHKPELYSGSLIFTKNRLYRLQITISVFFFRQ